MKAFKTALKVFETIIGIPLAIVVAILFIPILVFTLLVELPVNIVDYIWRNDYESR